MRRSTTVALVVLGAALAGFVFSSSAFNVEEADAPVEPSVAARPQVAELGWRESKTFERTGQRLVFEVERFQVLERGWRADVRMTNETSVAYSVGDPEATLDRTFGLMLFETGNLDELKKRNRERTLPTTRTATLFEPSLPRLLEPNGTWSGTFSAQGSLAAGTWVRIVFGTFVAVGSTGDVLDKRLVWITDRAYQLKR